MLTQTQIDKINAANQALLADADFANVSEINSAVTSTPSAPAAVTDNVDTVRA